MLAMPVVSLAIGNLLFMPFYQTNDDLVMTMLASGSFLCPRPSPYLLWIHHGLGTVLSQLYAAWPGVPWYRLLMISLQLLAGSTFARAASWNSRGWSRAGIVLAYFMVIDVMTYASPQYTITAALLAQSSVMIWLSCARGRPWSLSTSVICITLVTLGAAVRAQSCAMVFLLAMPLLVLESWRLRATLPAERGLRAVDWRAVFRLWIPVGVAGGLLLVTMVTDEAAYARDRRAQQSQALRRLVSLFSDFGFAPYDDTTRPVYQRVGLTANDRGLLDHMFFADREVFGLEKLKRIQEEVPSSHRAHGSLEGAMTVVLQDPLCRLLVLLVMLPGFFLERAPRARWAYFLTLVWGVGIWCLLAVTLNRPHFRVLLPIFAFVTGVGAMSTDPGTLTLASRSRRSMRGLAVLTLLYAAILPVRVLNAYLTDLHRRSRELTQKIRRLDPDAIHVVSNDFLHEARFPPMEDMRRWKGWKFVAVGTSAGTPAHLEQLAALGLEDPIAALHSRPEVRLICGRALADRLLVFLEEHRGVRARAHALERLDPGEAEPGIEVFRIEPGDERPAESSSGW